MVGGEPCRRDEATAAVRTGLVVISPPLADNLAGLHQRSEPVLVEALVAAGKPRAVVGSHCPRISPEAGGPIQHAHGIGAADAVVHGDDDALAGEVVGDGQALQAAAVGQRVPAAVNATDGIGCARRYQWPALVSSPADHQPQGQDNARPAWTHPEWVMSS